MNLSELPRPFTKIYPKKIPIYYTIKNSVVREYRFFALFFALALAGLPFLASAKNIAIPVLNIFIVYSYGAIFSLYAIYKKFSDEEAISMPVELDFSKNEATQKMHERFVKLAKNNTLLTYLSLYILVLQAVLASNIIDMLLSLGLMIPAILLNNYKAYIFAGHAFPYLAPLYYFFKKRCVIYTYYIYMVVLAAATFFIRDRVELFCPPFLLLPFIAIYGIIRYRSTKKFLELLIPKTSPKENTENYSSKEDIYHLDEVYFTCSRMNELKEQMERAKRHQEEMRKHEKEMERRRKPERSFGEMLVYKMVDAEYRRGLNKSNNSQTNNKPNEEGYTEKTDDKNSVDRFRARNNR